MSLFPKADFCDLSRTELSQNVFSDGARLPKRAFWRWHLRWEAISCSQLQMLDCGDSFCFSGHLNAHATKTVGILDLGGGSTQITFLPKLRVGLLFCTFDPLFGKLHQLNITFIICCRKRSRALLMAIMLPDLVSSTQRLSCTLTGNRYHYADDITVSDLFCL